MLDLFLVSELIGSWQTLFHYKTWVGAEWIHTTHSDSFRGRNTHSAPRCCKFTPFSQPGLSSRLVICTQRSWIISYSVTTHLLLLCVIKTLFYDVKEKQISRDVYISSGGSGWVKKQNPGFSPRRPKFLSWTKFNLPWSELTRSLDPRSFKPKPPRPN